jgi:hypothetical protein
MLYVFALCETADVKPKIHLRPNPSAASHDRFLRWQQWFVFAPVTLEFFVPLLYAVLHRWVLSELGSKTSLRRHDRLCSGILKHAKCFLCSSRHFHSTCAPGGHRSNQVPAARTNKLAEFLFLSVYRMLSSFTPFKCTDFFCNVSGNYE